MRGRPGVWKDHLGPREQAGLAYGMESPSPHADLLVYKTCVRLLPGGKALSVFFSMKLPEAGGKPRNADRKLQQGSRGVDDKVKLSSRRGVCPKIRTYLPTWGGECTMQL